MPLHENPYGNVTNVDPIMVFQMEKTVAHVLWYLNSGASNATRLSSLPPRTNAAHSREKQQVLMGQDTCGGEDVWRWVHVLLLGRFCRR